VTRDRRRAGPLLSLRRRKSDPRILAAVLFFATVGVSLMSQVSSVL
jgi:hypothetical protein